MERKYKYKQDVTLSAVSENELCVNYKKALFMSKGINLPVTVVVVSVAAAEIVLKYDANAALEAIISGALALGSDLLTGVTAEEDHRVRVSLWQIPQTQKLCNNLAIKGMRFLNDSIELAAELK